MISSNFFIIYPLLALSAAIISTAQAEKFTYTNGNLILGFQATGGDGSSQNVLLDLGKATTFRDNGNQGNIGNIGATLAAAYGTDWYNRTDLYFGVIGNLNIGPVTGFGSTGAVDGDPSRTFYLSRPTTSPGSAALIPSSTFPNSSLGTAGNNLSGLERVLASSEDGTGWDLDSTDELAQGLQKEVDGAAVLNQNLPQHATAWSNSWTKWNPTPGAAFAIFTGGIQQNFGKGGAATYIDVQRVLATNTGANPTGVVGGGTYVSTISISSSGQIFANIASTGVVSTPFEVWVASFPSLVSSPNAADRTPAGDFDKDGIPNIREFAFGGSPVSASANGQQQLRTVDSNGDSQGDLTLTVEVRSGATFTSSGNKLTANRDGVIYTIEGSLDLVTFESAVFEVTPTLGTGTPKAGYVFKTFRLTASAGLSGRGFIRGGAAVAP